MQHLFLGVDPEPIGLEPFIPAVEDMVQASAQEVGLAILPQAQVHCLPYLGAYVGADLVAGLLATGLAQNEGVRLLVDVGTNGEIILGSASRTVATAAPAGPAFEGAQIQDGMRASTGAIEAVTINPEGIELQVIGDVPPIGLCGSGLLDAVAQLRLIGLMLPSGRFVKAEEATKIVSTELARRIIADEEGRRSFVLAWGDESGSGKPIVLTQRDVRELQFAKGSIAGGIEVVMQELGVEADELIEIFLAGSFGTYINPQSARIIGLVPPVPSKKSKPWATRPARVRKSRCFHSASGRLLDHCHRSWSTMNCPGRGDFNDSFLAVLQFPELDTLDLEEEVAADIR